MLSVTSSILAIHHKYVMFLWFLLFVVELLVWQDCSGAAASDSHLTTHVGSEKVLKAYQRGDSQRTKRRPIPSEKQKLDEKCRLS